MDQFCSHRGSLRRECRCASHDVRRTVPRPGVCATDMAREPARSRSDVGSQCQQALCDGLASYGASLDVGRCERYARLAHLVRSRRRVHSPRAQALLRRGLGIGLDQYRLRAGFDDDRSLDWAPFRKTKAAVKMHTLLDLRGTIPAYISDGKMGDVNVLDFLPVRGGRVFNSVPLSTLCYRFFPPLYSRKPRFHAPCSPIHRFQK